MQRRELIRLAVTLLGATASGSVSRALMAGEAIGRGPAVGVFTDAQYAAVSLLSDMIIPRTDTPGAVDAGVPDFIAGIVGDWYTATERGAFMRGLTDLDTFCREAGNKPFHLASGDTRVEALREQERLAADYEPPRRAALVAKPPEDENAPFFMRIKELVVLGYYTSELGATEELAYLPMPGTFDGSYDFDQVGRQFTH